MLPLLAGALWMPTAIVTAAPEVCGVPGPAGGGGGGGGDDSLHSRTWEIRGLCS